MFKEDVVVLHCAEKIDDFMLQSRRSEKDFLLRKDKKYLDKVIKSVSALKTEANKIKDIAKKTGRKELVTNINLIINYADTYEMTFKKLVSSWEKIGLTHKSGFRGSFRNIAHTLSDNLKKYQLDELQVALLMIRRYEKDYIRTKSKKYKDKFTKAINTYSSLLAISTCNEVEKQAQIKALNKYIKAFKDYLSADDEQQIKYYEAMRMAAHDIEKSIDNLLIPNIGSLVLEMRKHEKDYLLRGDNKYVEKLHKISQKIEKNIIAAGVLEEHVKLSISLVKTYLKVFDAMVEENKRFLL